MIKRTKFRSGFGLDGEDRGKRESRKKSEKRRY